jgi:uncharacterized protein
MADSHSADEFASTQDERTMATLAHALQMVGWWIAPLIIFLVRRQSRFVSFHALQALLLQVLHMILIFSVMAIFVMTMMTTFAHQAQDHTNAPPPVIFVLFPIMWLYFMGSWILILTLSIVYSIKAGRGEWANYPVIGKLARKMLRLPRAE